MEATLLLESLAHEADRWAVQSCGDRSVVFTPPAEPLSHEELDQLYALPFTRDPHPSYTEPVPCMEMIRFSVTSHRGCGGGCTFCSLTLHQGRRIQSRSRKSILQEVGKMTRHPRWKGSISDVGGPSANEWGGRCSAPAEYNCKRPSCLFPKICGYYRVDQAAQIDLLRSITRLPHVKHVRVASGIRHDLALREKDYIRKMASKFVGGQIKIAPEHSSEQVLRLMRKPPFEAFEKFLQVFERDCQSEGREQYVIPYLLSAFPGCTDEDMKQLARWLKVRGWKPQQVQCFIPTPGTVATAMYYAGIDTEGNPIPVARSDSARLRQHHILLGGKGHL